MRIGAVADLHVDINSRRGNPDFISLLLEYLDSLKLDVLLIPGDVAGSIGDIIHFFTESSKINIPYKLFVPGNHDIWVYSEHENGSWIKYREELPEVCREQNWHYLPGNPIQIDSTVFFGSMGWYDYSTANFKWDNIFSEKDYMKKINPDNARWMDAVYAKFNMDDKSVAGIFLEELYNDIKHLGFYTSNEEDNNPDFKNCLNTAFDNIKSIICVTHIVPYMDFIDFRDDPGWDFFGAYIGNTSIGDLLDLLPENIRRLSFFGHTHFPGKRILESGVEGYCIPLGYPEEYGNIPLNEVFKNRIKVIEV